MAPPPQLYASNPPPSYSLAQKSFRRQLQEVSAPHNAEIRNLACPPVVRFPDVHMLEMDSGEHHNSTSALLHSDLNFTIIAVIQLSILLYVS